MIGQKDQIHNNLGQQVPFRLKIMCIYVSMCVHV